MLDQLMKPCQSLSIVLGDAALHYVRARIISDWRRLWLLSNTIVISSGQVEAILEYNDQCDLVSISFTFVFAY